MTAFGRWVGARLHRKLFFGFAVSILLTVVLVALVTLAVAAAGALPWSDERAQAGQFLGGRFAEVWEDPGARRRLARNLAEDFEMQVILQDARGKELARLGEPCSWDVWTIDVPGGPRPKGRVLVCAPAKPAAVLVKLILVLTALVVALWGASNAMARKVAEPMARLAAVTRDIGAGRFWVRAEQGRADEVGELAAAVNDMATRIQRQMDDQRALLAAVSHELRTPLGHVRLLVEIAREQGEHEETLEKTLSEIDEEMLEMDGLVGELLASSRLDFSSLATTRLDAREIAQQALRRVGLEDGVLDVRSEVPTVLADATLLARALANLLSNAKHHGGGVDRLVVRTEQGGVAFEVLDSGPGIPEAERDRIFRPFHRGRSGKRDSLGLGLSLVARIAEAHGGNAWAENRPEGGARVGFVLRLQASLEAPDVRSRAAG